LQKYTVRVKKPESKIFKFFDPSRVFQRARACRIIRFGSNKHENNIFKFFDPSRASLQKYTVRVKSRKAKSSSFLTRAVYFSELELAEIYGSGQKTGKQHLQVFCPEPCISASSSLQKYTVRVKKPENKIFKLFDPGRVFQRARACINIRFGSKNRRTTSSSFLPRAVYFSEFELAELYGSGQETGKQHRQFSDPSLAR
jgi:hypothetical protein